MINKRALKISGFFLILYSIFSVFGTIFLVDWFGHKSPYKGAFIWLYEFPVDWITLIVEGSLFFLVLNILFWSLIVYLITWGVISLKQKIRTSTSA